MSRRISTAPWDVRGGGLRPQGKGTSYQRQRGRTLRIMAQKGSDPRKRPRFEKIETPEYKEGEAYTRVQLEYMADEILRRSFSHPKDHQEHPMILLPEHLKPRLRREIYVNSGTADPDVVSGIYWRAHPQGRKINSDEQRRRNGASYYR